MSQMHIIVVDRSGAVIGRRSMADAWAGSVAIAKAKAYTAVAFSSNENALTTRSLGKLTQPGGPLWNIGNSNAGGGKPALIEFPGGMPAEIRVKNREEPVSTFLIDPSVGAPA
jgi:uncharacterized protein GlcG (DUF336 family)